MSGQFLSEIKIMSFNFAPKGWALCNGQLLPIAQNQALFSLLGTTYGGDGRVTFGLPDLRGRVPISMGNGFILGEVAGTTSVTLSPGEMAAHNHPLMANGTVAGGANTNTATTSTVLGQSAGVVTPSGSFGVSIYAIGSPDQALAQQVIGNAGGGQAHTNMQPFLTLNFCIALQGIFPSQN
jgi:microcystin-dependent protein